MVLTGRAAVLAALGAIVVGFAALRSPASWSSAASC